MASPWALTGISLVTSDAEQLSKCSPVTSVFFWEKLLAESFTPRGWDSIPQAALPRGSIAAGFQFQKNQSGSGSQGYLRGNGPGRNRGR